MELSDVLVRYGAAHVRWTRNDGESTEAKGVGGGLTTAVDRHGVLPLAHQLAEGDGLVLTDEDVSLELLRTGSVATLRVSWPQGPSYEETLALRDAAPISKPPQAGDTHAVVDVDAAIADVDRRLFVSNGRLYDAPVDPIDGVILPVPAESLGAASFRSAHGVRAAYVAGAMAGGIASVDLVMEMAQAGLLGFFGAGGLPLEAVEQALIDVKERLKPGQVVGFNLLHNPAEPGVEDRTVDLYLKHGIQRVSASAFMQLTPAIVRYRLAGIKEEAGRIVTPNHVFAKISRPETATLFLSPPPPKIVNELVQAGVLTATQAKLAAQVPMAEDVTVEADSGGHTDGRPLVSMLPVIQRLRTRLVSEHAFAQPIRVGAAGGIGDASSVHAAFQMGADYVLTGSVNQATIEAGTSALAKQMVAEASATDCTSGPAPDMFEIGAHVQVLSRGSLYAQRAGKLYELYRSVGSLEEIPEKDRKKIEKTILGRSLADVWTDTEAYWGERDPREVEKANRDPRHKMALVFRWYLGMTSRWARTGDEARKRDFQIWCGPSMGAFNDWVKGSWLEPLEARSVSRIAWTLLEGAGVTHRVRQAEQLGVSLAPSSGPPPSR